MFICQRIINRIPSSAWDMFIWSGSSSGLNVHIKLTQQCPKAGLCDPILIQLTMRPVCSYFQRTVPMKSGSGGQKWFCITILILLPCRQADSVVGRIFFFNRTGSSSYYAGSIIHGSFIFSILQNHPFLRPLFWSGLYSTHWLLHIEGQETSFVKMTDYWI